MDAKTNAKAAKKYVSEFMSFHFLLPVIDDKGNTVYHTDANGNNKLPTVKQYNFTPVQKRDATSGKVRQDETCCVFIADPEVLGQQEYERVVEKLNKLAKNPANRLYSESEYFKKKNPEAHRIQKEAAEKEKTIKEQAEKIAELERRLGFNQRKT